MKIGKNEKFWRNTKIITVLTMVFVIILSGCVDEKQNKTESGNETNDSQGITETNNSHETTGGDSIYGTENIENNVSEETSGSMSPKQQVITEDDNGKNISLENGSTFFLRLEENPTTGYSWELNLSQGLNNISEKYYPPEQPEGTNQPLVGAGGVHVWEIKAVSKGSQQITGIYKRPWEKVTGQEENFTLNIEVV